MKWVAFWIIYASIGLGVVTAAQNESGAQVPPRQLAFVIVTWPAVVSAIAFGKWAGKKGGEHVSP